MNNVSSDVNALYARKPQHGEQVHNADIDNNYINEQASDNQQEIDPLEKPQQNFLARQVAEILSTTQGRIGVGAGLVLLIGGAVWALSSIGESSISGVKGQVSTPAVQTTTKQGDVLNEAQAQHLTEQQRLEAERLAAEGKTNTPVLTSFTATKGANLTLSAEQSFAVNSKEVPRPYIKNSTLTFIVSDKNLMDTGRYTLQTTADGKQAFFERESGAMLMDITAEDMERLQAFEKQNFGTSAILTAQDLIDQERAKQGLASQSSSSAISAPAETAIAYSASNGNNTNINNNGGNNANNSGNGNENFNAALYEEDSDVANYRTQLNSISNDYQNRVALLNENANANYNRMLEQRQAEQAKRQSFASASVQNTIGLIQSNPNAQGGFSVATYGVPNTQSQNAQNAGVEGLLGRPVASNTSTQNNSTATQSNANVQSNGTLPKHIVRAGTAYSVMIIQPVNTDNGTNVVGQIIGGQFAGAKVYGQVVPSGRNIGVNFTAVQPANNRLPLIPVSARAESIAGTSNRLATDIDRHYVQNYSHMVITSAMKGYGDAYANSRTTTTVDRADGSTVSTREGGVNDKEIAGGILREVGARLQNDISHLGNRPATFKIAAGTVLQMRLLSDWDTTATTSSIQ